MIYIGNGFSSRMVEYTNSTTITIEPVQPDIIPFSTAYSIVGHDEIAADLGVKCNREFITLKKGDILYVAIPKSNERLNVNWTFKTEGYKFQRISLL